MDTRHHQASELDGNRLDIPKPTVNFGGHWRAGRIGKTFSASFKRMLYFNTNVYTCCNTTQVVLEQEYKTIKIVTEPKEILCLIFYEKTWHFALASDFGLHSMKIEFLRQVNLHNKLFNIRKLTLCNKRMGQYSEEYLTLVHN